MITSGKYKSVGEFVGVEDFRLTGISDNLINKPLKVFLINTLTFNTKILAKCIES